MEGAYQASTRVRQSTRLGSFAYKLDCCTTSTSTHNHTVCADTWCGANKLNSIHQVCTLSPTFQSTDLAMVRTGACAHWPWPLTRCWLNEKLFEWVRALWIIDGRLTGASWPQIMIYRFFHSDLVSPRWWCHALWWPLIMHTNHRQSEHAF